jgi:hypothetical protein
VQPCALHGRAAAFLPVSLSRYHYTLSELNSENKRTFENLEENVKKFKIKSNFPTITQKIREEVDELHKLIGEAFKKCTQAQDKLTPKDKVQEFVKYYLRFMKYIWIATRTQIFSKNMAKKLDDVHEWKEDEKIQVLLDRWNKNLVDSAAMILDPEFSSNIIRQQ